MQFRLKEPLRRRIVLVDTRPGADQFLECLLSDRGLVLVGSYGSLGEVTGLKTLPEADLVIVYLPAVTDSDAKGIRDLSDRFDRPILVMTESDAVETVNTAMQAGAHSVLCTGASSDRLRSAAVSAIASHERLDAVRRRADEAERALQNRKLIERAKGILMQQRGISEEEALRELQRTSMQRNEPLPEVSRTIIAAKELLG